MVNLREKRKFQKVNAKKLKNFPRVKLKKSVSSTYGAIFLFWKSRLDVSSLYIKPMSTSPMKFGVSIILMSLTVYP